MGAPVDFIIGPVSIGAAKVLSIGIAAYAGATGVHAWRAHQQKLPDRGSATMATFVMAALAWTMWTRGASLLPAPYSLAVLGVFMAGVLITFGYTLSNAAKRLERMRTIVKAAAQEWAAKALPDERREAWMRDRLRLELGDEEKRKTPHLMMGFFVVIYGVLGGAILSGIYRAAPASANFARESWHNLEAAVNAGYLASGHIVSLICLLGLLFLMLPVEMVRLQFPELDYPFKGTITSLLREKERGSFGAHYYITATLPLAVFWLAADSQTWDKSLYAVVAVLTITVFADAASALIGVRYGRKKWAHHPGKSWMGSFGGTAAAFVLALPLTGLPIAVVSAAVFLLVDILAPVPFSVSDNILNPLALGLAYILLADHLAPWLPYY